MTIYTLKGPLFTIFQREIWRVFTEQPKRSTNRIHFISVDLVWVVKFDQLNEYVGNASDILQRVPFSFILLFNRIIQNRTRLKRPHSTFFGAVRHFCKFWHVSKGSTFQLFWYFATNWMLKKPRNFKIINACGKLRFFNSYPPNLFPQYAFFFVISELCFVRFTKAGKVEAEVGKQAHPFVPARNLGCLDTFTFRRFFI